MSRYLFLLCFTLGCALAHAQNIVREDINLNYIFLPAKKLPDSTETYCVVLTQVTTPYSNIFFTKPDADKIRLNGYYRLPSEVDADIIVEANLLNELMYKGTTLEKETFKYKKDKNSPEILYTAYTYSISYSTPRIHYTIKTGSGVVMSEETAGGQDMHTSFGNTNYSDHYSSEYELRAAWGEARKYKLAEWERYYYESTFSNIPATCATYCLMPASNSFNVRYVKEKKTNVYDDLRQAKDLLQEGISYMRTDKVELINKLVQPDYEKRVETINKAIVIWEKALEESDLKNKKARIDPKVTRHIYYNLAIAYALINNYEKAQQYLQGREDEETNKVVLKNVFAGMKSLSAFIDYNKKGYEANSWRKLMTTNDQVYAYKDPSTRQREQEEAMKVQIARQKEIADSIKISAKKLPSKSKPKSPQPKQKGPTKPKVVKGASVAKGT